MRTNLLEASTGSGKTTALMMAAFDPEKLRLLLDRGADVHARASSGFTALMVATQYGASDAPDRLCAVLADERRSSAIPCGLEPFLAESH